MKKTKGKFETLLETAVTRFMEGGYLTGDLVRLRKDAMGNAKLKTHAPQYMEKLRALIENKQILKVSAVKAERNSNTGYLGNADSPTDWWVDVYVEMAPGMWIDPMTVPMEILEKIDVGNNRDIDRPDLRREQEVTTNSKNKATDAEVGRRPITNIKDSNTKIAGSNSWKAGPGGGMDQYMSGMDEYKRKS